MAKWPQNRIDELKKLDRILDAIRSHSLPRIQEAAALADDLRDAGDEPSFFVWLSQLATDNPNWPAKRPEEQTPALNSRWIHRETLTALTVIAKGFRPAAVEALVDGMQEADPQQRVWIPMADLHRDYIEDLPLTAEWLDEIGWRCFAPNECYQIDLHVHWVLELVSGDGGQTWKIHVGYIDVGVSSIRTLAPVATRLDLLRILKVFGVKPVTEQSE